MALYHVSLVKGKKNDGTRIKAVEHVKTSTVRRSMPMPTGSRTTS